MLPIVWIYIAVVMFLWIFLLYTELRKQARGHVKGCPSLPYICPERLHSLIIIEPDLKMLELCFQYGEADIPDAQQIPIDQLEIFVGHASRSTILVFYASIKDPVNWKQVQLFVRKYSLRNVYVLKGGLEAWQSYQRANAAGDIGPSTHRATLA